MSCRQRLELRRSHVSPAGDRAPYDDCLRIATTLKLRAGRALRLGPDAAFRQRLPGAVARSTTARQRARAELATQVPAQQAAAASKLAATFRAQAASLTPLAPASRPWSRALVWELAAAGRAYRGVAAALRTPTTARSSADRRPFMRVSAASGSCWNPAGD